MYTEIIQGLSGTRLRKWEAFLSKAGLVPDSLVDKTVILWDGDEIAATGSRYNNILKLIAVDSFYQGEDLTSTVISELRRDAFAQGYRSLFLYTKPQNEAIFSSLFFYPIAKTDNVLLMEDRKDGVARFVECLPRKDVSGKIGAIVMNGNPFTLGHKYLIERAASECNHLYVFVLSEDKSEFSAEDRIEMARLGTEHLNNVSIMPTGPYLISSATFPTYFLKDRDNATDVQCRLDIEIFSKYFTPHLGITHRYVGSEPLSALTDTYNKTLSELLPSRGVEVIEFKRIEHNGEPISASKVRQFIKEERFTELTNILPKTTIDYIRQKGYIK